MDKRLINNTIVLPNNINKIADVMDYFDYPIDIKDVWTKKYIYNNLAASTVSNLSKEERVGMDVRDIAGINNIKEEAILKVIHADYQVVVTALPVTLNHVFLDKNGVLLVDKVVKKLIYNEKGKPLAILSYANTITRYVSLIKLYDFYKIYYRKKIAVNKFLQHVSLEKVFLEPPTDQELQTLLAMQASVSSSKYIAKKMDLSPRTVEEYKGRLRSKLHGVSFEKLLDLLRNYGRYSDIIY